MFKTKYIRIEHFFNDSYWYKSIFDKNKNRIYYEDSYGYWSKYYYDSYDSYNHLIYFENSDGDIKDYRNV